MPADPHGSPSVPTEACVARVLLIDESKVSCLVFSRLLAAQPGIAVRYATRLAAGLQLADEFMPTVLVRAVDADDTRAVGSITDLMAHRATRNIPILAFSMLDDGDLRRRALAAGAFDYVVKSEDGAALIRKVQSGSRLYYGALGALLRRELVGTDGAARIARVLMIDDSRALCVAFERLLRDQDGIVFEYGTDPRATLELAARFLPTVILLDLEMPEVTGFDLLPALKSNPRTQGIPVIVLSSITDPAVKARAFRLGANDYAEKQMDGVELVSRLRYHSAAHHNALQLNGAIQELIATKRSLELQRNFMRNTFGRYLSDEVVSNILETPDGLRLGGEQREIAVLMADLRGFTAITEGLAPEHVLAVLNNFLELMTGVLMRWNGTIDEILGDAILAMFGAPIQRPDDAARAVACAVDMQLAMERVNVWNRDRGFPELAMGIGINTGAVVVGNIGSERRAKYGVVGRNVNLAARIESCTVGGQIMISESTRAKCGDLLRVDGRLQVSPKGFEKPIAIYEIGGIGGEYGLSLPPKVELELRPLAAPIPLQLAVLEGKRTGRDLHDGVIVRLHAAAAELQADVEVEVLHDLRISVLGPHREVLTTELYAKVVAVGAAGSRRLTVRFTSVPAAAAAVLEAAALRG
jgi:adenylate cyclase